MAETPAASIFLIRERSTFYHSVWFPSESLPSENKYPIVDACLFPEESLRLHQEYCHWNGSDAGRQIAQLGLVL